MALPATAQVKGGLFEQYGTTLRLIDGYSSARRFARQALSKYSTYGLRTRMDTLCGEVWGGSATKLLTRVRADEDLGGKRTIEPRAFVQATTTTGDIDEIDATIHNFSTKTYNPLPVANRDGNPLGTR